MPAATTAELIARLDLPLAQGDAAATVVTGTVIEHAPQDHITCIAFAGGQLLLVSPEARAAGDTVKLRVQARDVSLTLTPPQDSSILNIVPATVAEMREDSPGQWMVALQAGPTRLLARVTQRSAHTLQSAAWAARFCPDQGHCHRELMGGSHLCAGAFRPAGQEAANESQHGTRPLLWRAGRIVQTVAAPVFTAP